MLGGRETLQERPGTDELLLTFILMEFSDIGVEETNQGVHDGRITATSKKPLKGNLASGGSVAYRTYSPDSTHCSRDQASSLPETASKQDPKLGKCLY